jgi:hypothetical protein
MGQAAPSFYAVPPAAALKFRRGGDHGCSLLIALGDVWEQPRT